MAGDLSAFMQHLKYYRQQKGLTQRQLATHLRIGMGNIARYERGEVIPKLDVLLKIADSLEASLDTLCGLDTESDKELSILTRKMAKLPQGELTLLKAVIKKFVD